MAIEEWANCLVSTTFQLPGSTGCANASISPLKSSFELYLTGEIIQPLVDMTNLEGTGRAIFWATVNSASSAATCGLMTDRHDLYVTGKASCLPYRTSRRNGRIPLFFNPGLDVCKEEQLVRQYIASKPAEYGIKIWVNCDVRISLCVEDSDLQRAILEMTEGLQGNTITCNIFFTSYALAEEMLRRKVAQNCSFP